MGDGHCSMRFEETRARGLSTSFFALLDDQIVPASCVVGHPINFLLEKVASWFNRQGGSRIKLRLVPAE